MRFVAKRVWYQIFAHDTELDSYPCELFFKGAAEKKEMDKLGFFETRLEYQGERMWTYKKYEYLLG